VSEPRVVTEVLGGSALSRAAQAGQLPAWYGSTPGTAEDWRRRLESVRGSVANSWLRDLEPALSPSGAARERLMRAAVSGVVVTTGQQPGPFGGPLMTLAKALTALAFADTLERTTGVPVAPVFWAATDDADFDEASVVSVALDGGAQDVRCEPAAPAGTPMSGAPLQLAVDARAVFAVACGSVAGQAYYDAALETYRDGTTIGDAYVTLLRRVLEPLGIAVLDASHPAVSGAGTALLTRAAARAEAVAEAVRQRSTDIERAGFVPQVDEVPGLSLVFLNTGGTKRRLTVREAAEFKASSAGGHGLSATVLLRPVLERAILPTAAYVGGPGEIAYFAQVGAVADALDAASPFVVPRWSATVLEPRIQRILETLGARPAELAEPHALETRLARARLTPESTAAMGALRERIHGGIEAVASASAGAAPAAVFDGVRHALEHRIARLERRVLAGVKRRETEMMRAVATAQGSLYPHGARQERKLSHLALLARYGQPLMDRLLEGALAHAQRLVTRDAGAALPAVPVPERAS
jgi:bacillithiol biosynthesis cysteine-adding enzyme BshC